MYRLIFLNLSNSTVDLHDMEKEVYAHSTYFLTKEMKKCVGNQQVFALFAKVLYAHSTNISSIKDKNTNCTGKLTCTGKWNFDRLRTVYPQSSL